MKLILILRIIFLVNNFFNKFNEQDGNSHMFSVLFESEKACPFSNTPTSFPRTVGLLMTSNIFQGETEQNEIEI